MPFPVVRSCWLLDILTVKITENSLNAKNYDLLIWYCRSNTSPHGASTPWACRGRSGTPGTPHWYLRWGTSPDLSLTPLSGSVCRRQHLLLPQAGLHLLCQPVPRAPPGQHTLHCDRSTNKFSLLSPISSTINRENTNKVNRIKLINLYFPEVDITNIHLLI